MCVYIYVYIYIYIYISIWALRASRPRDLDLCKLSIANLLDDAVLLFFQGRQLRRTSRQFFVLKFCCHWSDSWSSSPIIGHAKLFRDVKFHLFYGQLLRRNARQFLFSEVSLALVKFICFLCISVACTISMRALRAVLLAHVDCCKSIYVGNNSVCWTFTC